LSSEAIRGEAKNAVKIRLKVSVLFMVLNRLFELELF
jgi:hypothetical protein